MSSREQKALAAELDFRSRTLRLALDAGWEESDHPRKGSGEGGGQFTSGGGGGGGGGQKPDIPDMVGYLSGGQGAQGAKERAAHNALGQKPNAKAEARNANWIVQRTPKPKTPQIAAPAGSTPLGLKSGAGQPGSLNTALSPAERDELRDRERAAASRAQKGNPAREGQIAAGWKGGTPGEQGQIAARNEGQAQTQKSGAAGAPGSLNTELSPEVRDRLREQERSGAVGKGTMGLSRTQPPNAEQTKAITEAVKTPPIERTKEQKNVVSEAIAASGLTDPGGPPPPGSAKTFRGQAAIHEILMKYGVKHQPGQGYKPELDPYQHYAGNVPDYRDLEKELRAQGFQNPITPGGKGGQMNAMWGGGHALSLERTTSPYNTESVTLHSPTGKNVSRVSHYRGGRHD